MIQFCELVRASICKAAYDHLYEKLRSAGTELGHSRGSWPVIYPSLEESPALRAATCFRLAATQKTQKIACAILFRGTSSRGRRSKQYTGAKIGECQRNVNTGARAAPQLPVAADEPLRPLAKASSRSDGIT